MKKFIEINENQSIDTVGGGFLIGASLVGGGVVLGVVADEVVERNTGSDISTHIGNGLEYVGDGFKWLGKKLSS